MTDEQIAALNAQSNTAVTATLAGVLQQCMVPPDPPINLAEFMGYAMRAGDPTLVEWLDQFDAYAGQAGEKDTVRAVVLLDHLGGCAREEVLCQPDMVQEQPVARQGRALSPVNSRLLEIAQTQQELQKQVMELATQQSQTAGQMQVVIDQFPWLAGNLS